MSNLFHGYPSGHTQANILAGPTVPKEVPTSLVVGVDHDLGVNPLVTPEVEGHDMCQQFQIGDRQFAKMRGWGGGEKLMRRVVVPAQPGGSGLPSIGGCVKRDMYFSPGDEK